MIRKAVGASNGIAIGKAYLYVKQDLVFEKGPIDSLSVDLELQKFAEAVVLSKTQLVAVRTKALQEVGEEKARIFDAHIMVLEDPTLLDGVSDLVRNEKLCAAAAIEQTVAHFARVFAEMDNEYMRERAADIKDVGNRLLHNTLGIVPQDLAHLAEAVIVIASDLTPSDTISMDKNYVKAFAVDIGGRTSHAAIMARTLEIPAVLGLSNITSQVKHGDMLILDGSAGLVIIQPTAEQIDEYKIKQQDFENAKLELRKLLMLPSVTTDGHEVEIVANVGSPQDVTGILAHGGQGVGLFRTEFLYMGQAQLPTEEQQFAAYKAVAEQLAGPTIIRTLDIGGDKECACFDLPKEKNPFLGWRAIRISLADKGMFKTQLRAILRASAYGTIYIMYPMISGVGEVREANQVLAEAKQELQAEKIAFDEKIKVGIMVEIPSAAITAEMIAPEVDFFSIGTNDLCQYTLAVDRMNEKISDYYQPLHPAILFLVKQVIDVSHRYGKFTGMCGELAGDPIATLILLGLGLDEFSMSASSMLTVKKIVRNVSYEKAREIASYALTLKTPQEITAYSRSMLKELNIDIC